MGLDPDKIRGAVTIYRHRRSSALRIQPMCRRGRLGLADAGQPLCVPHGDDDALFLGVQEALESYVTNSLGAESHQLSRKEQAQFIREHDSIMVVRLDDGMELTPWEHVQGGFAANDSASIMLRHPVSRAALVDAIREAFQAAQ